MEINEPLWSVEETAAFLGVTPRALYDWRARRYGPPARRLGRWLRYVPADVRGWVASLDTAA